MVIIVTCGNLHVKAFLNDVELYLSSRFGERLIQHPQVFLGKLNTFRLRILFDMRCCRRLRNGNHVTASNAPSLENLKRLNTMSIGNLLNRWMLNQPSS